MTVRESGSGLFTHGERVVKKYHAMSSPIQSPVLKLLHQIDAGITIYEPYLRTPEKLREFDDTVARLQEMERLGLINRLFVQTRTHSGEERIDMVMVTGGLTEEGRRMLQHNEA